MVEEYLPKRDAASQAAQREEEIRQLSELVQLLDKKCAELELDAERYRWLREKAINFASEDGSPWCVFGASHDESSPADGKFLDDRIDLAMQQDAARAAGAQGGERG